MVQIADAHLSVGETFSLSTSSFSASVSRLRGLSVPLSFRAAYDLKVENTVSSICDLFDAKSAQKCTDRVILQLTVCYPTAFRGDTGDLLNTGQSTMIDYSFFEDNKKLEVTMSKNNPIIFHLPRKGPIPGFSRFNMSNSTLNAEYQIYNLSVTLASPNSSIHVNLKPSSPSMSYLLILNYGGAPIVNNRTLNYSTYEIVCPQNLTTDNNGDTFYTLFASISANVRLDTKVGIGFRQLTELENQTYCALEDKKPSSIPVLGSDSELKNLTVDFSLRIFSAGCYFIDPNTTHWSSYGVDVLSSTNATTTVCSSQHLTAFAGGFAFLPASIDFSYVFSDAASFARNPTIYLTVIIVSCLYLILVVLCRYLDYRDTFKSQIHLLKDNDLEDLYFYELMVFTGNRQGAGTDSNVRFNLTGDLYDSETRELACENPAGKKGRILQRSGVDSFIMSVGSSLGSLSYMRIWHDNSGKGEAASWFLRFIIVHDLQTREKFYFICNKWLAVDKSDGRVERVIPLAGNRQKLDLAYLAKKQAKAKLSDSHLWYVMFKC